MKVRHRKIRQRDSKVGEVVRRYRSYTEEEVQEALMLWYESANYKRVARKLGIPPETVRGWTKRKRWADLRALCAADHAAKLRARRVALSSLAHDALENLLGQAKSKSKSLALEPKEIASLLRSIGGAINDMDRLERLDSDKPTERHEHTHGDTAEELLSSLNDLVGGDASLLKLVRAALDEEAS